MEHQKGTWNELISIKLAIQLCFNMLAFHIQEVTTVQSSIPIVTFVTAHQDEALEVHSFTS